MKFSKIAFAAAFCVLFAVQAEARTLYVDASRPNNKGNGLKFKAAKKTIQAAINIAKKGDTILVYPGTYAPIKTNNKKITIKGVKGASKTIILSKTICYNALALAQLGKAYSYVTSDWSGVRVKTTSTPLSKGKSTKLVGLLLDGLGKEEGCSNGLVGISGGTATSCTIQRICGAHAKSTRGHVVADADSCAAYGSKLVRCTIRKNIICNSVKKDNPLLNRCEISRCKILDNQIYGYLGTVGCAVFCHSTICNSLIAGNSSLGCGAFYDCKAINCTITGNTGRLSLSDFWATIVNCIYRDNFRTRENREGYFDEERGYYFWEDDGSGVRYLFVSDGKGGHYRLAYSAYNEWQSTELLEDEDEYSEEDLALLSRAEGPNWPIWGGVHNWFEKGTANSTIEVNQVTGGSNTTYRNTNLKNKDPKFVNAAKGNYKLKKGSYAIDKGKLTVAQKKLVGSKDLAGKRRIKGKAIDRGCYEY